MSLSYNVNPFVTVPNGFVDCYFLLLESLLTMSPKEHYREKCPFLRAFYAAFGYPLKPV